MSFCKPFSEEIRAEQERLASRRGRVLQGLPGEPVPRTHVYTPGQLLRWAAYDEMRKAAQGCDMCWFADLEQNPTGGASTPGRCLPSMLTHGTVHDAEPWVEYFSKDRLGNAIPHFGVHADAPSRTAASSDRQWLAHSCGVGLVAVCHVPHCPTAAGDDVPT